MAELALGSPPFEVHVEPPAVPTVHLPAPVPPTVTVVPVPGPPGPPGTGADVDELLVVVRDQVLAPHVQAPEPHPAYDDLPSLRLLFENGLI